jgi:catechol 2,3-dioxygenase-like lactoylglutathione lyase family enzyme
LVSPSKGYELDHVAIAAHDVSGVLDVLVGTLGVPIIFGGVNLGFRAMQVEAGNLRIELLEPWNVEQNDFLKRFLERSGEGPHHLTFKTSDIRAELERVAEAGYHPVGVNIDNDFWKEAFIHPKEAGGTVVQIAQSAFDDMDFDAEAGEYGPGRWWSEPPPMASERAHLERVVISTVDVDKSLELYRDLLGGEVAERSEGWLELVWPGGGRIRIESSTGEVGIDRLEWTHPSAPPKLIAAGTRFQISRGS